MIFESWKTLEFGFCKSWKVLKKPFECLYEPWLILQIQLINWKGYRLLNCMLNSDDVLFLFFVIVIRRRYISSYSLLLITQYMHFEPQVTEIHLLFTFQKLFLSSSRQHLNHDVWRKRRKIIRTVLCYIEYSSCTQNLYAYMNSSYRLSRIGFHLTRTIRL